MPSVGLLKTPAVNGMSLARTFALRHGYIPLAWYSQLMALRFPWYDQPKPGTVHETPVTLFGYSFGCDYCARPMGRNATCDGCGATYFG